MIYIRADGNEKIGMGHVMRCLTIADQIKQLGEQVCFLVADEQPTAVIQSRGYEVKILFTYYDQMDVELPQLMLQLSASMQNPMNKNDRPILLIDSYFVTDFYLYNVGQVAWVAVLDDLGERVFPCNLLINYNIYGPKLPCYGQYPEETVRLLGSMYTPLRSGFSGKSYQVRDTLQKIMVTTGGGDSCHMTLALARRIIQNKQLQKYTWQLVCGPYCPDKEELREIGSRNTCLLVVENQTDLSEQMRESDLVISAAGSTLYEICAIGVPAIGFYFVENQRRNMEAFDAMTPIRNAGDFSKEPEQVLERIETWIGLLEQDKELREKMSLAMGVMVDGCGANRIARALIDLRG